MKVTDLRFRDSGTEELRIENRGILDVGVKSNCDNGKTKKEIRLKSFRDF